MDLKNGDLKSPLLEIGFTNRDISISKHIYLLSEQGYMLLVGFMKTDKAKEIRKQLRREYFAMREVINSIEQQKANLLLSIYNGGQEAIIATRELVEIETKPLKDKIEEDKPKVGYANAIAESSDSIDIGTFSKLVKDENVFTGGRNKLFEWLRDNKYLNKNNEPYQRYIEQGIFELKQTTYKTPYGVKLNIQTLVTAKGQIYLTEKLRSLKESY